jgi:hypothetical protein
MGTLQTDRGDSGQTRSGLDFIFQLIKVVILIDIFWYHGREDKVVVNTSRSGILEKQFSWCIQ